MRTTERQRREGEPTIDDMRYDLAEQEAMNISVSQIIEILLDGVQGLHEIPNIEIKDEWNQLFGENS
ncbi:hypothetical protein OAA62_00695 [bacterium]|nr:hypothetical protein [bacterium]